MYIGGKDIKALHYMVERVIENSLSEVISGKCDRLTITLLDENTVSVSDNGTGIPVTKYMDLDVSVLEIVLSRHGYFDRVTGQFNGTIMMTELASINTLSTELKVQVRRDGYLWEEIYHYGEQERNLIKVRPLQEDEFTGTTITFTPDFSILEPNDFSYSMLARRFREFAFLTKGLTITLIDERSQSKTAAVDFYYPNGAAEFVEYLNRDYIPLHKIIHNEQKIEITPEHKHRSPHNVEIEFAFQYIQENASLELSYANTTFTPSGGTHADGFKAALDKVIGRYDLENGLGKYYHHDFVDNDLSNGLTAVVAIKHPDIQLSSQFRPELLNPEARDVVYKIVMETLEDFANTYPDDMRRIVERCLANRALREQRRG